VTSLVHELGREEDARRLVRRGVNERGQRVRHRLLADEEQREGALKLRPEPLELPRHPLPMLGIL
jgi:hypothetical protein